MGLDLHQLASAPTLWLEELYKLEGPAFQVALKEKNENGDTVLHQLAENPDILKKILDLLPQEERLSVIQEKNTHHADTGLIAPRRPPNGRSRKKWI